MSKLQGTMRHVITGDNDQGESVIIIDGGRSTVSRRGAKFLQKSSQAPCAITDSPWSLSPVIT